ncbi:MAG: winged helix-turn-helix domain-containing protein, partial [Leadbetterella sp.]
LLVRIKAILKRSQLLPNDSPKEFYSVGQYSFYPLSQILKHSQGDQKLTTKEAKLLELFCQHPQGTITRSYSLKMIWGDDTFFNARSMDVYITKLRKYLSFDPQIQILNLHGEGFKLISE